MWSCCHEMQEHDSVVEQAMNLMKYNFLSLWFLQLLGYLLLSNLREI